MTSDLPKTPDWLLPILTWFEHQPVLVTLMALMLIDVIVGVFLAISRKTLNSTISWRGMSRKAIMLLIVGMGLVLQPFMPPGIPIANLVACFYVFTEALSILEGAAAAGVPLPAGLVDSLSKLRDQQRMMREQKTVASTSDRAAELQDDQRRIEPPAR